MKSPRLRAVRAIVARPALAVLAVLAVATAAHAEPAPVAPVAPVPAAAPAAAPAIDKAPSFEIRDRGDAVEIIAYNIKAARTAILPVRSRLQIPIVAGPAAKRLVPGDATVKLVELAHDDATRMLSVKLGFERLDVKTLARFAQVTQVGEDLHVIVPRKVPTAGTVPTLPEPTLPPALAAMVAKLEAPPTTLGPRPDPAAKPAIVAARLDVTAPTKPAAVPAVKLDASPTRPDPAVLGPTLPAAAPPPAPAPAAPARAAKPTADKPLQQVLAPEPDDGWSRISLYGALGLAAVGGGVWMMRRRKGLLPAASTIDIIAQRSLGGKARIVWLSAGQREMIVSVTGQQVRMLGQWRKTEAAGSVPRAQTFADGVPESRDDLIEKLIEKAHGQPREFSAGVAASKSGAHRTGQYAAVDKPLDRALSPAVSGILRLRGRTGQMATVGDELATGDVAADELWAREILAATGARR
jgi:flagellar biogenesis protein FliO